MPNRSLSATLKQAKEDASVFVKIESGDSVRLHIISQPKAFANVYFAQPPYAGAPKTLNVPFGTRIPGFTARPQWAFEVIHLVTGDRKLLACGACVAEDILDADISFRPKDKRAVEGAGFSFFDIVLERTGAGLKTRWSCVGIPTVYTGDRRPVLDMDDHIKVASAAELARLSASGSKPKNPRWVSKRISPAQESFIAALAKKKGLPRGVLLLVLQCKFDKGAVSELTDAETSLLAAILHGL
jgi:hypothetical protein